MCNYCGNCTMFCPYSSDPYREKFSLFATETEFRGSELPGFYRVSPGKFLIRMTENGEIAAAVIGKDEIDVNVEKLLRTLEAKYAWLL